jgi:hypothetical protein
MISTGNGVRITVREYARNALGLTDDEADRLFYADNTVDDLHQLVKKLVNGEDILGGETENGGEST